MSLRLFALALAPLASSLEETEYSTNAICRENNCIHPVFPGLSDLELLESFEWQCTPSSDVREYLTFCKDAVNYDASIPNPNQTTDLRALVQAQDTAAVTAYVYHMAGMNLEAHKFKNPEDSDNDCVRQTWMLICHTYFPKAQAGCTAGTSSPYMRPCKNVCERYVDACQVRCCDESAKCVFEATISMVDGSLKTETAYVDKEGPASTCTGAATRSAGRSAMPMLTALVASLIAPGPSNMIPSTQTLRSAGIFGSLALLSMTLQGCDYLTGVGHSTANWEDKASYYTNFQYIPPGKDESQAVLNSCEVKGLDKSEQCNGNGECKPFNSTGSSSTVSFCRCYRDWADPECRTKRKSQQTAFLLSLFGGIIGLDHFYLGEYYSGFGKLSTAGGLGFWWIWDIVRIGSSPVYASNYRLANDLPHSLYIFLVVLVFAMLGYIVFGYYGTNQAKRKRMKKMMLEAEDEFFRTRSATTNIKPTDRVGMPTKSSYGTLVPVWEINRKILQQAQQMGRPQASIPGPADLNALAGAGNAAAFPRSSSHAGSVGTASVGAASVGQASGGGAVSGAAVQMAAAGASNAPTSSVEAALRARMAASQATGPSPAGGFGAYGPQPQASMLVGMSPESAGATAAPGGRLPVAGGAGMYAPSTSAQSMPAYPAGGQQSGVAPAWGSAPAVQYVPQPVPSSFGGAGAAPPTSGAAAASTVPVGVTLPVGATMMMPCSGGGAAPTFQEDAEGTHAAPLVNSINVQ